MEDQGLKVQGGSISLESYTKKNFWLGIFGGISVISTVGFIIVLFMLLGQGAPKTADAQPSANNNQPAAVAQPSQPAPPSAPVPELRDTDHVRGNADAAVTLIEYSDFECPFCSRVHPNLVKLMEEYPNDVKWVYRHFPLGFHQNAQKAAEAAECAGEQGKFWEYADHVFANQGSLSDTVHSSWAQSLGLNVNDFDTCLSSGKYVDRISQDFQEGAAAGVQGTPATFVNGQLVEGALPYDSFKQLVEQILADN